MKIVPIKKLGSMKAADLWPTYSPIRSILHVRWPLILMYINWRTDDISWNQLLGQVHNKADVSTGVLNLRFGNQNRMEKLNIRLDLIPNRDFERKIRP